MSERLGGGTLKLDIYRERIRPIPSMTSHKHATKLDLKNDRRRRAASVDLA